jgi:hypothetical protein
MMTASIYNFLIQNFLKHTTFLQILTVTLGKINVFWERSKTHNCRRSVVGKLQTKTAVKITNNQFNTYIHTIHAYSPKG